MGFLLVALSVMLADMIVKYETVLEYFYSPAEKMFGNKQLIDNEVSADAIEAIDMNSSRPPN